MRPKWHQMFNEVGNIDIKFRVGKKCWMMTYDTDAYHKSEEKMKHVHAYGKKFCKMYDLLTKAGVKVEILGYDFETIRLIHKTKNDELIVDMRNGLEEFDSEICLKDGNKEISIARINPLQLRTESGAKDFIQLFRDHEKAVPKEIWVEFWNTQFPDMPAKIWPIPVEKRSAIILAVGEQQYELTCPFGKTGKIDLNRVNVVDFADTSLLLHRLATFKLPQKQLEKPAEHPNMITGLELE